MIRVSLLALVNIIVFTFIILVSLFITIFNTLRLLVQGGNIGEYYYAVLIGLDQMGGSFLYGTEDYTISSHTYFLHTKGNKHATKFMRFIDFMAHNVAKVITKNEMILKREKYHCRNSYLKERSELIAKGNA